MVRNFPISNLNQIKEKTQKLTTLSHLLNIRLNLKGFVRNKTFIDSEDNFEAPKIKIKSEKTTIETMEKVDMRIDKPTMEFTNDLIILDSELSFFTDNTDININNYPELEIIVNKFFFLPKIKKKKNYFFFI